MKAPGVNAATARTVYDHFSRLSGSAIERAARLSLPSRRTTPAPLYVSCPSDEPRHSHAPVEGPQPAEHPDLWTAGGGPGGGGAAVLAGGRLVALVCLAVFALAGITDYLDGYFARAYAQQSRLGRMLDPIADKLLVSACLLMLVYTGTIAGVTVWAALVILCREIWCRACASSWRS